MVTSVRISSFWATSEKKMVKMKKFLMLIGSQKLMVLDDLLKDLDATQSCQHQPSIHRPPSNATAPCLDNGPPPSYTCCDHQCALMTSARQNTTRCFAPQTRPSAPPPPYQLWLYSNNALLQKYGIEIYQIFSIFNFFIGWLCFGLWWLNNTCCELGVKWLL